MDTMRRLMLTHIVLAMLVPTVMVQDAGAQKMDEMLGQAGRFFFVNLYWRKGANEWTIEC